MSETTKKSCGCCAPTQSDLAGAAGTARELVDGVQETRVRVKGGYTPETVRLSRGIPARLVFDRQESSRCSEELLIPAFGVRAALPENERTVVDLTPTQAGVFAFTCGMGMLRGEIVVD